MHIPTAQEQLKFLKNIQLILQSGSFSSTYKFALFIILKRLAIEKWQDTRITELIGCGIRIMKDHTKLTKEDHL